MISEEPTKIDESTVDSKKYYWLTEMKKFTASANMGEYLKPENTWDCYVYGYVFNTQDKYVDKTNKQPHILYGVVPGHSQDAMIKTIKVID